MIVTQICQGLMFDLLVSNYWVKFRSLFLVALASRLQNVPSSKLVKPLLPISLVPECKRSSSCSFTFTWGLKCWWPLWWGNVAYAYLGCCHTSDLPGWLRKVKAALQCLTLLCSTVSTFCLGDACVRPSAVSSQELHDDEIPVMRPARGREREGGVTVFLISIYYEFPLLATVGYRTLGWMDV